MTSPVRAAPSRVLSCEAPAKVNLALHVTGRRDDGYHLLDTVAVFAGVSDRLEVAPPGVGSLEADGPFAPALGGVEGDNLVLRAARAMAPRLRTSPAFRLTKNLPVAAGIGGGSADAAAALRLLCELCETSPLPDELSALALSLGADVPMCLECVPLRARGIGEEIELLPGFPQLPMVLVNPRVPVSTGGIFRRLAGRYGPALPDPAGLRDLPDVLDWLGGTRNDLQEPAAATEPAIEEALAALRAATGCRAARMSGSGATCFGVFMDMGAADRAAAALRERKPGWWIEASLTRRERPEIVRSAG